jgi:colanic acid/amylovoran biosynthesis glycosyltransferase
LIKNIKIAIYTGTIPSTTFIERLILGLSEKGLKIYLFGFQNKKISSNQNTQFYTYTSKISKLFQLLKYSFLLRFFKSREKKKLDSIIVSKKSNARLLKVKYYPVLYHHPDIFHIQWAKSIEDWVWVQEFGMKLVVSLRGTHVTISPIGDKHWAKTYAQYFPQVDRFHAVSESMIKTVKKFGADPSKIDVVRSGLNIDQLSFQNKIKKNKSLNIISVGRSHWAKGYSYGLDAIQLFKNNKIDFNYTIIGVEDDEELLYKRSLFNLEKEISFIGNLPFDDVVSEIQKADVLLLPSVEEGIANVVLEAMALGTLVVATECGGMKEVITNNENGFLTPIRDVEAMNLALIKVSKLTEIEYQKITNSARKKIEEQYSHNKTTADMVALYQRVITTEL